MLQIQKKVSKTILDSHNINHVNSILTSLPLFTDFRIDKRHFNKELKEMATIYAGSIKQNNLNYHTIF